MKNITSLVWFKKDLRTVDHAPLYHAALNGDVTCIYIYEDEMMKSPFSERHFNFLQNSLIELDWSLRKLGSYLQIFRGDPQVVFSEILEHCHIEAVYSHEETGDWKSFQRDKKIATFFRDKGIHWNEFQSNGVVRGLKSRESWQADWNKTMNAPILNPSNLSTEKKLPNVTGLLPSATFGLGSSKVMFHQPGGHIYAQKLLTSFVERRGKNYSSRMSSPLTAKNSCSRLSTYLSFGCISIKEVYQEIYAKKNALRAINKKSAFLKSLNAFTSRLYWHCHFIQKLEMEPSIEFKNLVSTFDGMREEYFDQFKFEAWTKGETGFPMIDACMRSLIQTGWINFRMRAMLISFASYNLWLDWRKTSKHLASIFTDYEPGIHYNQVQMQSGVTGINTIRIYNPIKQQIDHDPTGKFVKTWCPELADLPIDYLTQPHLMSLKLQNKVGCAIGIDYPAPIVDLKISNLIARKKILDIKKLPLTKKLSQKVYEDHGSRKRKYARSYSK
tara:strand:+ start:417 stop:1916 length:1500 start_codon:yes stop_codon:yes gene_type:complete